MATYKGTIQLPGKNKKIGFKFTDVDPDEVRQIVRIAQPHAKVIAKRQTVKKRK